MVCWGGGGGRGWDSDTVSRQPCARGEVGEGDSENQRDPHLPLSLNDNWPAEPMRTALPRLFSPRRKGPSVLGANLSSGNPISPWKPPSLRQVWAPSPPTLPAGFWAFKPSAGFSHPFV